MDGIEELHTWHSFFCLCSSCESRKAREYICGIMLCGLRIRHHPCRDVGMHGEKGERRKLHGDGGGQKERKAETDKESFFVLYFVEEPKEES